MEKNLETIWSKLKDISDNLRKLGPARRAKYVSNVENKILDAKKLYECYEEIIRNVQIERNTSELNYYIFETLKERIELVYNNILSFKNFEYYGMASKEESIELKSKLSLTSSKMESFDIKTAISLIPVMDNTEETIEKIVDGIEMYNEYLGETTQKNLLISFVLKTRLNKSAKLKLKSEYNDVKSLIQDIRNLLLTKKSANSILSQLNNLSQSNMSIREYGDKLSELFVGLTIAQSDGQHKACEILRPINENLAIKRFAEGLRNRRLSTIISARDYSELKDAVRAAEDEELGQPSTSNNIFNAQRRGNVPAYRSNHRGRNVRMYRGNYFSNRGQQYSGNNNNARGNYVSNNYNRRNYNNVRPSRGYHTNFASSSRGRENNGRGRQRTFCSAQVENTTEPEITEPKQFFRA